jgi:hypothetical protein
MECGLVGDKTMNDGGAVAPIGKAQSVEPGGTSWSQKSFEADFVPSGVVMVAGRCVAHCAARPRFLVVALPGWISARRFRRSLP